MNIRKHGPQFNNLTSRFSSRDCLGIENVAASISAEICPIVNTVTPRAFYWPFLCWIYYDFYKNSGIQKKDVDTFCNQFLKRQDYFFVLANLLVDNPDQYNLVGKQKTSLDKARNLEGPFSFNKNYFQNRYGGMQYYNAGCLSMSFIVLDEEDRHIPKLTQYGEEMALAFEEVIKGTTYYRQYRLKNIPVPKDVLIEYGHVINLGLNGFDKCKSLLRRQMFEAVPQISRQLNEDAVFAGLIYKIAGSHSLKSSEARHILYDYYSPRGNANECPKEILNTVRGWEIIVGRHYFTAGIEMIWKYMLNCLSEPLSIEEWIHTVLNRSTFSFPLEDNLETIIADSNYGFNERESVVENVRRNGTDPVNVESGLRLMLSVYNRFADRKDLQDASVFLDYGKGRLPGTGSISINEWSETVHDFYNLSIGELLAHIMKEYIIQQHIRTCFEKLTRTSQSVDGFYFELIDDVYIKNEHIFQVDFQGLRILQLMQVMKDLDMFDKGI